MSLLSKLFMWFHHITFKPSSNQDVTYRKLLFLFKAMRVKNIFISDSSYNLCDKGDIRKFLSTDFINLRKYVPEKYDCDNFSFSLMGAASSLMSGYAIGIVWVNTPNGKHALNFFLDEMMNFWFIEPQTDYIFQNPKFKPYLIVM